MKKMKKFFAVILSLAMVLGMCTVASAADGDEVHVPKPTDTTDLIVTNVESGATVTAYQITKGKYDKDGAEGTRGFEKYVRADGITEGMLKDPLKPEADEVGKIAKQVTTLGLNSISLKEQTDGSYKTTEATAGYWIVVVTNTNNTDSKKIYNPMLLGAYYRTEGSGSDNTLTNQPVDASKNWQLVAGDVGYAKSGEPDITKIITSEGKKGDKGDDVAIGDTVSFQITTDIPSYSDEYTGGIYQITDRVVGLEEVANVEVFLNDTNTKADDTKYTITPIVEEEEVDGKKVSKTVGFTINFDFEYIKTFVNTSNQQFVVTYTAKVSDNAMVNFDPRTNTAKLTYTNGFDAQGTPTTNEKEKKTYHYTFAIDANATGSFQEPWSETTEELVKTGEVKTVTVEGFGPVQTKRLEGAEFTLTRSDGKKYVSKLTDGNGRTTFTGLDAGKYTLTETKAPEGYSINSTEVPVEIRTSFREDGTLEYYEIQIGEKISKYTGIYGEGEQHNGLTGITYNSEKKAIDDAFVGSNPGDGKTDDDGHLLSPSDTYEFVNTKLSELPSTGGIGTTIFTIGGCVIMIAAAALFFASRKKSQK